MRVLLDTHALIWAQDDPSKLGAAAVTALTDPANELLLSAATFWEMGVKVAVGKLQLNPGFRLWIDRAVTDLGLTILPITLDHAERQVRLPLHHRDPFDRLLAAQSLVEAVHFVSGDLAFDAYGVARIWD